MVDAALTYVDAPGIVESVINPTFSLSFVPMHLTSLPWVNRVATTMYPDRPEVPHTLFERLSLFPLGCLVLWGATGDAMRPHDAVGYMVSHPWNDDHQPPPANGYLHTIHVWESRRYVIHDLVILPAYHRWGYAAQAVGWAKAFCADVFDSIDVLATGGSEPFWVRQGFAPAPIERAAREADPERATGGDAAHLRFALV